MKLFTNRYGSPTCNLGFDAGFTVSTPIYVTLTLDKGKSLLNAFRQKKLEQLKELGWSDIAASTGSLVTVTDKTPPPITPLETELGMNEETLRGLLLSRTGISEKTLFKLQELIGEELVTREDILTTVNLWLDELIPNEPIKETSKPKTRKTTATRTQRKTDS